MKKFLSISGPNLNLLGQRKTSIYKEASLDEIHSKLKKKAAELGVEVDCVQFNSEGDIIDCMQIHWIGHRNTKNIGIHWCVFKGNDNIFF